MHRTILYKIPILISILFYMTGSYLFAQSFSLNFTAKDGLENQNILAITEDLDGYIYVGTASGIMHYDGVRFNPLPTNETGAKPENVFIYDLLFDQRNNLWVWSELNGIYHWDRDTNNWTNYSTSSEENHRLENNDVSCITAIDSFLYFSYQKHGLNTINIYDLSINKNIDKSTETYSDIDQLDQSLLLNARKNIFQFKEGELIPISKTKDGSFKDTEIYEGQLFLTKYESGLFKYEKGQLRSLELEKITDPWRTKILGHKNKELYIICRNSGLLKYHLEDGTWQKIFSKPFDSNSLIKGQYNNGFIDSRGIIWIATTKGISCFNPNLQGFQYINNLNPITDYLTDAIFHNRTGNYITTYASTSDKVKIYDSALKLKSNANHTPNIKSVRSIYDLMIHNDDVYAISHHLLSIDPRTGKTSLPTNKFLRSLTNIRIANIDQEGNMWLIQNRDKLVVFNLNTNQIITEKKLPLISEPSKIKYNPSSIYFDKEYAFISAGSVFYQISKTEHTIHTFCLENNTPTLTTKHPPRTNNIYQVTSHKGFTYILSRSEGIFKTKYNPSTSTFEIAHHLTTKDLYSPINFEFDRNENLWVATDNGLALLNTNLTLKRKFNTQNGLSTTKLSTGISILDNKIFINGEDGIIIGDTKLLTLEHDPKKVDINSFKVNGKEYINPQEELIFHHTQKNISLSLSIPVYGTNSDYSYQYRLLGSNNTWKQKPIENNEIIYENLNPGDYEFQVKSTVGLHESETSIIQFEINPPFWKTSYFMLLMIGLIALALTLFYRHRIKKKVQAEKINTLLSQLENTAIRSQLNPHFIFNSLNSIRSMILLDRKNDSVQYLEQFSDMIREVLQMSKEEKVTLDHEISFNKNYLELEKLRFANKFNYNFNLQDGLNAKQILVPPLIIQPFVENAIWHGLLHNDKESILNIDIRNEEGSLHIIIDDNGLGREKSKQLQKSSIKKTKKNLGVSLSKKRISMLGKNANVKITDKYTNNIPAGTSVHITIPITYE